MERHCSPALTSSPHTSRIHTHTEMAFAKPLLKWVGLGVGGILQGSGAWACLHGLGLSSTRKHRQMLLLPSWDWRLGVQLHVNITGSATRRCACTLATCRGDRVERARLVRADKEQCFGFQVCGVGRG